MQRTVNLGKALRSLQAGAPGHGWHISACQAGEEPDPLGDRRQKNVGQGGEAIAGLQINMPDTSQARGAYQSNVRVAKGWVSVHMKVNVFDFPPDWRSGPTQTLFRKPPFRYGGVGLWPKSLSPVPLRGPWEGDSEGVRAHAVPFS